MQEMTKQQVFVNTYIGVGRDRFLLALGSMARQLIGANKALDVLINFTQNTATVGSSPEKIAGLYHSVEKPSIDKAICYLLDVSIRNLDAQSAEQSAMLGIMQPAPVEEPEPEETDEEPTFGAPANATFASMKPKPVIDPGTPSAEAVAEEIESPEEGDED